MIRNCLLLTLTLLSILSCSKKTMQDQQTQNLPVNVYVSLENLSGKTVANRSYNIENAKIFLSHFELVDDSGHTSPVKDLILANNTPGQNFSSFTLPPGNYTKLRFHFGLDAATNNSNPASFDASNPLSLSQGMYWGPLLKYTFLIAEGKLDSSSAKNQTPSNSFSMNLGTDTLYREITLDLGAINKGGNITIHINLNKLFVLDQDTFNITYFVNHSTPLDMPNGIAITDSLVNAIKAEIYYPIK